LTINSFIPSKGEIIKETSNVFAKPNGSITFVLYKKSEIICGIPKDQWIEIVFFIPSTKEYFTGIKKLKKGDILIDSTGKKVGEVLSDIVEYMPLHNNVNNKYFLRLYGYISTKNIEESSIPEKYLEKILIEKQNHLLYGDLKNFLSKYKFYKLDDFLYSNKYECYFYYADYFWDNNIHLVFESHRLIAILHTRDLKLSGFEDLKLNTTNLLWLKQEDLKEKESFAKEFKRIYEESE
jgi:hypothetical protein